MTADLHGHLPPVPDCDVLVIAGDMTPPSDHGLAFQRAWLDTTFRGWLSRAPAREVVAIAGNHDFLFERAPESAPELPWTYLQDSAAVVGGLRFWGSPWTPWFFDWAFNAPQDDVAEEFLAARYATAPEACDVVVVHGPPAGYGDLTARGQSVGSGAFLSLIDRIAPRLAVFGHIHEGRGEWMRGASRLVNASAVDLRYALVAEPIQVFEV